VLTDAKKRCLFSFGVCIVFFLIVGYIFPVQFTINDDVVQMYIFAGYYSGTPHYFTPHTSMFFGLIINGLYHILPLLPMYTIFLVGVMFISCWIIVFCVLETANQHMTPFSIAVSLSVFFLTVFALPAIISIQYTLVAGLAAAASLALAIIYSPSEHRIFYPILIIGMLILSYIVREDVLYPAAVLMGTVIIYKIVKSRKIKRDMLVLSLLPIITVCLIASLVVVEAVVENTPFYHELNEYKQESYAFMDYNMGSVTAAELGLSEHELAVIRGFCYLTENIGVEFFAKANEIAESKSLKYFSRREFIFAAYRLFRVYASSYIYLLHLLTFYIIFSSHYLDPQKSKSHRIIGYHNLNGLFAGAILLVIHALMGYLCLAGRFPWRVFYVCIILIVPFMVMSLCAIIARYADNKKITHVIIVTLAFTTLLSITWYDFKGATESKERNSYNVEIIESYARIHPNNIYIYDNSVMSQYLPAPFKIYREKPPLNLMFWGGWNAFTPTWYSQLEANGLESLDFRSFTKENVFLMTKDPSSYHTRAFTSYVEEYFGEAERYFRIVDGIYGKGAYIFILKYDYWVDDGDE
jgi:hypothetical protein